MQRSVRGATTIEKDTKENVLSATKELLQQMISRNNIKSEDIVNIIFTATRDIESEFPAVAAREVGLVNVPLIDCQQMVREGALEFCIRIMLTYNTTKSQLDINHVYLHRAQVLRPDLLIK
ncbi:chorismate mutase [Francisella philomiragia]|uniref:chorismate mutase n=2 Tax=Francisella philomiragia TaxID=28110 RepID=A0AAW3DD40_9GAMM|nr:chorismate mutase [Francisella philomiragia]AJI47899.1 chorismate mutase [Francisella philomiragia]AJI49327.1 chorismate mutase [Francisella philomiragia]AJI54764.1 chorismate mutase [Francisella philomiragia]AJI75248.1 chorismate mutase [Francisella philomiragia subsp. philomiragia ATCC 25015]EET20254.1 chorismate mutase [Francisella philomiragia subsp. philomiragia ATCC 25015]